MLLNLGKTVIIYWTDPKSHLCLKDNDQSFKNVVDLKNQYF